jgi:CBS domain-containing protein
MAQPLASSLVIATITATRPQRPPNCLQDKSEDVVLSQPIRSLMDRRKSLCAPPETTVKRAAALMAGRKVGAIMVVAEERLVGIFTERDALFRVIAKGLEPAATRLADVMTRSPLVIDPDKTYGYALLVMQENGFRHMPVIENGKPIGIISSRNAMDPELEEFAAEAQRRKHILEMHRTPG